MFILSLRDWGMGRIGAKILFSGLQIFPNNTESREETWTILLQGSNFLKRELYFAFKSNAVRFTF